VPELEDSLRAEVTRRMEEFEPSADLLGRIHTRVRLRRRQRRALAAASASALVVAVAVGAFMIRPGDAVEVSEPALPRTTDSAAPVDTTEPDDAPDGPSATTGATDPIDRLDPPDPPDPTRSPGPTAPPTFRTTTEPPATTEPAGPPNPFPSTTEPHGPLKPPDNDQPTHPPCTLTAEIVLAPEGALPPCAQVTADQRLQVRNDTEHTVTVSIGAFVTGTVEPGATAVIGGEFGSYLEPGAHFVDVSPYDPALPEIWFDP
jgi:hypothetical protein